MIATIASGHVDLADFLFLLASIVAAIVVVLVGIAKPVNIVRLAAALFGLLIALAWFVL